MAEPVVDPESVLTPQAWAALQSSRLPEVSDAFYLAGGTGLALHLGHRISVDLDWFSATNELGETERRRLLSALGAGGHEPEVRQEQAGTLGIRWHGVLVSFYAYRAPLLEPPATIAGSPVASVPDIAAMKLSAIVGRGSKKDFVDIHFLLQQHPLEHWLDLAAEKYPRASDFRALALRALLYFDDADVEPMPTMIQPLDWDAVKHRLRTEAVRVARDYYGVGDC